MPSAEEIDRMTKGFDLLLQHRIDVRTVHKLPYGQASVTIGPKLISDVEKEVKKEHPKYIVHPQVKEDAKRLHKEASDRIIRSGIELSKLEKLGLCVFRYVRISGSPENPITFV